MKKNHLLFIPFIFGIGIGLFSCNFGNGSNIENPQNIPAVILGWDMSMGTILGVQQVILAAPSITDVYEGDCIFLNQFTIDYDNQPYEKYLLATNISKEIVNQTTLEYTSNADNLDEYTLPLSSVIGGVDFYYDGRIFVGMNCKDKNPGFRLIYNPDEPQINGVKNFYLQAKPSSETANSTDVAAIHAFNLKYWIQSYGRDTTLFKGTASEIDFKYIKANLNYVSKVTSGEDDKPIPDYETVNDPNRPIEIFIFKVPPW